MSYSSPISPGNELLFANFPKYYFFLLQSRVLVQEERLIPTYTVGEKLNLAQDLTSPNLHQSHANQLYQLFQCLKIYLKGDVRKETE